MDNNIYLETPLKCTNCKREVSMLYSEGASQLCRMCYYEDLIDLEA